MKNEPDINLNLSEIVSATTFIKDFKSYSEKLIDNPNNKFFIFKKNEPCMVVITPQMYKLMNYHMNRSIKFQKEKEEKITKFILNLMDKDSHYDFCETCNIILKVDEKGTSCPECKKDFIDNKCTIDFIAHLCTAKLKDYVENVSDLSVDTTYKDCIKISYESFGK